VLFEGQFSNDPDYHLYAEHLAKKMAPPALSALDGWFKGVGRAKWGIVAHRGSAPSRKSFPPWMGPQPPMLAVTVRPSAAIIPGVMDTR
jgi:hypothetical protein